MNDVFKSYEKYIPYLYFISITAYWFTVVNRTEGLSAYPILLFGIPFAWQLLRPNRQLNFYLGITFMCISVYLIFAYYSGLFNSFYMPYQLEHLLFLGGILIFGNFLMSLWMIKNSLKAIF